MNDSSTSQDTGTTVADAAERIESLLGNPADSATDETQEGETSDATEDEADPSNEDDAEPEDGEQSEDQDESEEADGQPELYTVKVAGEEVKVTLDEALKGYSREQDYTRKTQAHAEQVKADNAIIAQARDEYLNGLQTVQQIIERSQPKIDQSLRDTNPAEWSAQMLQHRQWAEERQAVAAEQERIKAEQAREQAEARDRLLTEESEKLLRAIPEWSDPKVRDAESPKLIETGKAYGFEPDEIGEVVDHRAIAILRDAMRYRELVAKSKDVSAKVEAKKVAKPGTASAPPSKAQALQRAQTRLRQSGRVDDAAAAIERLMSR